MKQIEKDTVCPTAMVATDLNNKNFKGLETAKTLCQL